MTGQQVLSGPSPVFIFGCQRSGTSLLQEVLAQAPGIAMFHEGDARAMTPDCRILPRAAVQAAIASQWPRRSVFKPLCDSQGADRLLAEFPTARAIWIYRDYRDVAGSLLRTWPGTQRTWIDSVRHRRPQDAGWMGERLTHDVVARLDAVWRPDLSDFEAGCLLWCVRNHLYFVQGLERMPERVLLLSYQDLVLDAERVAPLLFDWLGVPYEDRYAERILTWNVGKETPPPIAPGIAALCQQMLTQLDAARYRFTDAPGTRRELPT